MSSGSISSELVSYINDPCLIPDESEI